MPEDVNEWLEELGLGQYADAFEENAIDAEVLPELTDLDLEKMGVKLGHRKKLLKAISAFEPTGGVHTPAVPIAEKDPPPATGEAERRQLTVMFCDLVGSTALSQRLDPEDLREINRAYQDACKAAIERYEGYVARYMGDGVLAYFGYPQAHEDDAERAIHAGLSVIDSVTALRDEKMELAVRVGVATGPVVVGDLIGEGASQESAVVGETPNLAARLQALAAKNTVVIGPGTHDLTGGRFEYEDLSEQTLKGIAEPVRAWRVKDKRDQGSRFETVHAENISPMVGRDEELEILYRRWQRAAEGEGQVVLISGEAGIGKSRLSRSIRERISNQPHATLSYQCSPFHVNSTLHAIISHLERGAKFAGGDSNDQKLDKLEALMSAAGQTDHKAMALFASLLSLTAEERYGPLVGTAPQLKDLTLAALLERIEHLASEQCILMVFEDVHWIDPTTLDLLDLLDLLINRVVDARVLVILTHRPEFEGTWVGEAHVTTITLNKLAPRNCTSLVSSITGGRALPDEVLEEIVDKTNGVPLFIEELTKTIIESGMLRAEDERFVLERPLVSLAIPATLRDSLMARLDRLAAVKDIAQIGAVIGREFDHELIREVAGISDNELNAALKKLSDAGLVFRRGTPPYATYLFKHALVQDTAYESLLKSRRQQLHGKIASTLEISFPTLVENQPELAAHHFFEADLTVQAVKYWRQAGLLAGQRSAVSEAISHRVISESGV